MFATTRCCVSAKKDPTDPYWAQTVLLMHMDGSNNGTTFTDQKGNTVTKYGNTITSTTQSKFGGSSVYFDGTGDNLQSPNSDAFRFRTGDFTVEFWMYCNVAWTSMGSSGVVGQKASDSTSGWQIYRNTMNDPTTLNIRVTGDNDFSSSATPSTAIWEQWAVSRQNGTLRWFKNGVLTATYSVNLDVNDSTGPLNIGLAQTWGGYFNGYIDELRITKGVARYIANFTPPIAAFPNS